MRLQAPSFRSSLPCCAGLALRSRGRLGFLAAIGALVESPAGPEGPEGVLLEAVVFGRPNEALSELMPLEEKTLQELYVLKQEVHFRVLRSMPYEPLGDRDRSSSKL